MAAEVTTEEPVDFAPVLLEASDKEWASEELDMVAEQAVLARRFSCEG